MKDSIGEAPSDDNISKHDVIFFGCVSANITMCFMHSIDGDFSMPYCTICPIDVHLYWLIFSNRYCKRPSQTEVINQSIGQIWGLYLSSINSSHSILFTFSTKSGFNAENFVKANNKLWLHPFTDSNMLKMHDGLFAMFEHRFSHSHPEFQYQNEKGIHNSDIHQLEHWYRK